MSPSATVHPRQGSHAREVEVTQGQGEEHFGSEREVVVREKGEGT